MVKWAEKGSRAWSIQDWDIKGHVDRVIRRSSSGGMSLEDRMEKKQSSVVVTEKVGFSGHTWPFGSKSVSIHPKLLSSG